MTDPRIVRLREVLTARGWTVEPISDTYEVWVFGNQGILVPTDLSRGDYERQLHRAYRQAADTVTLPVEGTPEADELVERVRRAIAMVECDDPHQWACCATTTAQAQAALAALRQET